MIDIGAPRTTSRLTDLLERFRQLDSDLEPADFDPAAVIGNLRDEIDAIKMTVDRWKAEAETLRAEWIVPLVARERRLLGRREKLLTWMAEQMIAGSDGQPWERLPGNAFVAKLHWNPPALKIAEEANAITYGKYPGFVRLTPTFQWDKDRIKAELDAGHALEFACETSGRRVAFGTNKETAK